MVTRGDSHAGRCRNGELFGVSGIPISARTAAPLMGTLTYRHVLLERIAFGMSSLEPEFEQLLSSYLDGAVTDAERELVEARLATDADAARELAELRSLTQAVSEADVFGEVRLPQQFADQVIEAAIERARLEGHPDDHPLLRSVTQPLGPAAPGTLAGGRRWWAASAVGLAVAASLLIAVTMLRPQPSGEAGTRSLALIDNQQPSVTPDITATDDGLQDPVTEPTQMASDAQPSPMVADVASVDDSGFGVPGDSEPISTPLMPSVDGVDDARPSMETVAASAADSGPSNDSDPMSVEASSVTPVSPAATTPNLKMAMVLNLRLTESALGMAVIRDAMRTARVDADAQRSVTSEIVASIGQSADGAAPSGSLLYLRAPAKQMDRFIAALLNDGQRVAGVGWSLTAEPIVLDAVSDYVGVDPTEVQHEFTGVLSAQQVSVLRDRVDDVVFIPADASGVSMVGVASQDSGPDVIAHVLVLVGS